MLTVERNIVTRTDDGASQVIQEAESYFVSQGQQILGNGFSSILGTKNLYDMYTTKLCEGMDADNSELLGNILNNSRTTLLENSMMGGIAPVSSLQGPMLRKYFPKLVIKDAFPTEVAVAPRFKISFFEPYYIDAAGKRYAMPKEMKKAFEDENLFSNRIFTAARSNIINISDLASGINLITAKKSDGTTDVSPSTQINVGNVFNTLVPTATAGVYNVASVARTGNVTPTGYLRSGSNGVTDIKAAVAAALNNSVNPATLDANLDITGVAITFNNGSNDTDDAATTANNTTIIVPVKFKRDMNGGIRGTVNTTIVVPAVTTAGKHATALNVTISDTIVGYCDLNGLLVLTHTNTTAPGVYAAGTTTITGTYGIQGVVLNAYISTEMNEYSGTVRFDIGNKEVVIGTGDHMNAALPIEYLTDVMAMYKIDGALKVVDIMSTYFAQRTEKEAWVFLKQSFANVANELTKYSYTFNCYPPKAFAGLHKDWIDTELKRLIDGIATTMRVDFNYPGGKYVIIGNPLDVNLIMGINWVFQAAQEQKDGVEVSYSQGNFNGANYYEVIASDNVAAGALRIMFYPSQVDQFTYKYYPYAFNVEQGTYRDPNAANVPSIMMTKRHTFEEFTPLQGVITITNNYNNQGPLAAAAAS
jgi:hypothetical protein